MPKYRGMLYTASYQKNLTIFFAVDEAHCTLPVKEPGNKATALSAASIYTVCGHVILTGRSQQVVESLKQLPNIVVLCKGMKVWDIVPFSSLILICSNTE